MSERSRGHRSHLSWDFFFRSTTGTGTRLERRPFVKGRDKALKAISRFYQESVAKDPVDSSYVDLLSDNEDGQDGAKAGAVAPQPDGEFASTPGQIEA